MTRFAETLRPQSSCEAKSLALMAMRDLWGIDIMADDDTATSVRVSDIADQVMRVWDQDSDADIVFEVARRLRCATCGGVGEHLELDMDCDACRGRGWRLF